MTDGGIEQLYTCKNDSDGLYLEISHGDFNDNSQTYIGNIFENRVSFGPLCVTKCWKAKEMGNLLANTKPHLNIDFSINDRALSQQARMYFELIIPFA
jgi:hypothetical protein